MSAIIFCETGMSCTRWGDEAHTNTLQASGVLQETSKNNSTPSRAPGEATRTIRDKKVVRATLEQTTKDMQATHMTNATLAVPSYAMVHDRL